MVRKNKIVLIDDNKDYLFTMKTFLKKKDLKSVQHQMANPELNWLRMKNPTSSCLT